MQSSCDLFILLLYSIFQTFHIVIPQVCFHCYCYLSMSKFPHPFCQSILLLKFLSLHLFFYETILATLAPDWRTDCTTLWCWICVHLSEDKQWDFCLLSLQSLIQSYYKAQAQSSLTKSTDEWKNFNSWK